MSIGDDRRLCPYVGLQPFEDGDREFFFGRERDQRIIISNLLASPLTILYGSSGVGKSSVLMAGVVPQLRRDRPRTPVVVFRDWADGEFQSALTRLCIEAVWKPGVNQPKPAESLPFDEILRACAEAAHETVLVLFDQFEEYFLYHPKSPDPRSFEAQFARAVNRDDVDVGFLIALREDGLSKLDRFQERIPNLMSNRLRLEHLDPAGAADAIRKPLAVWNRKHATRQSLVSIEDDLVSELIRQVKIGQAAAGRHGGSGVARAEEGYIEAPFLQLVMVRLWAEEMGAGSNALRRETLDRLEGAMEIVRTHLDDVMGRLEPASQAVCATFFDRLVTPTGSKVACSTDDLVRWAGDLAGQVPGVLESLSRDRILRTVAAPPDNPEATRYEIFHDVLAPAILEWRRVYVADEERKQAVAQAREQAEKRALRRWRVVLATMTAIAVAGWMFATWEELRSEANQKAAESAYTTTFDAGRGLDLALQAVKTTALFGMSPITAFRLGLRPTPAAEDALRQALQASRLEWTLDVGTSTYDIAFTRDGRMLATAGKDKTVKIWNISTGLPRQPRLVFEHDASVRGVEFLPAGDRLATVADDKAYLWSLDDPGTPIGTFAHGESTYGAFALSLDGRRLATAGSRRHNSPEGRLIKVWDLTGTDPEPDPITVIDVAHAWVRGLAFSPDGCCLATACVQRGGAETWTSVWDIDTGRKILSVPNRAASDAVTFTPDGKSLVTASRDARTRVWQPVGDALDELLAECNEPAVPEEAPAPSGSADLHWSERILAGHDERIRNIAVSPDGARIVSASADRTVKLWDTETGENLLTLSGHRSWVEVAKFSPDGHYLATASRDGRVKFWNIAGHNSAVTSIAFSPDGETLATGGGDRTARLWDLSRGAPRLRRTLRGHSKQIYRVAFDPTGKHLATAGLDGHVKLWDLDTGTEIPTVKRHKDQLRGLAFSPDGKHLASAGADGFAWLYDLDGTDGLGAALRVKHYDGDDWTQASAVAFHPRADQWATSGHDGKLRLWTFSGGELGMIAAPVAEGEKPPPFGDFGFSPDGSTVAAVAKRQVYLWPVEAFQSPPSEPSASIPIKDGGYCDSIAYSPDGERLAVGCDDPAVRFFDTASKELVMTITVHKKAVRGLAFSPDGTKLATASEDKTFHVSPLRFDELYEAAKQLHSATSGIRP